MYEKQAIRKDCQSIFMRFIYNNEKSFKHKVDPSKRPNVISSIQPSICIEMFQFAPPI